MERASCHDFVDICVALGLREASRVAMSCGEESASFELVLDVQCNIYSAVASHALCADIILPLPLHDFSRCPT